MNVKVNNGWKKKWDSAAWRGGWALWVQGTRQCREVHDRLESMSASFTLEWILTFCSEEEESLFIAHSVQCSSLHLTHPSGALCNQHAETRGVNSSSKPVRWPYMHVLMVGESHAGTVTTCKLHTEMSCVWKSILKVMQQLGLDLEHSCCEATVLTAAPSPCDQNSLALFWIK